MSVESSAEGGTRQARTRRARFREWRTSRPFAGGVLLCLAGLLIAWVPLQFAFELLLVGGAYTFIGLAWAVGVFLTGAFVLYRPEFSTIFGVIGVVLSILSLLGALGGLFIGMILGIVGGNLCVAWSAPDASGGRNGGTDGDGRPVRTDGGSQPDEDGRPDDSTTEARLSALAAAAVAAPLSRLRSDGAIFGDTPRGAYLDRVRRYARRAARDSEESFLRAKSPAAPGRIVDAATAGGVSKRLAVTVAVLVVTSGTLTLVSVFPAAAILGDEEQTTYTVDVGEIRLGDGGQICAASVGSDTYRVTITDATLVDTTFYQQRGDEAVKADFPTLEVDDTIVMYTKGGGDQLDLLATTVGCTDEDQTSRTVFRNRYQTGTMLRGSDGVTMLNMESTGATVPEAGGFQFVAPDDDNGSSTPDGVEGLADDVDDVLDGTLADRLDNRTDDLRDLNRTVDEVNGTADDVDGTVENATSGATNSTEEVVSTVGNTTGETVENTTREVADGDPPENASGTVDGTTDAVDNTTGEVTNTTDDAAGAADEAVTGDSNGTTSEVVDGTTDAVDETTDEVTDGVDETAEQATGSVEETETPTEADLEETVTPTEVPVTPTDDGVTPTAEVEDDPDWLDQVDDGDEANVLETVRETEGGIDDVSNVTEETSDRSEESIEADDNLTRLDNGTVLLLNGTDPGELDWLPDLPLETDSSLSDESEAEAKDGSDSTETESDDDSGGSLAGAAG